MTVFPFQLSKSAIVWNAQIYIIMNTKFQIALVNLLPENLANKLRNVLGRNNKVEALKDLEIKRVDEEYLHASR